MKSVHFFGLTSIFSLLISFPALAAPIGESAGEIWIDGPAEVQPGSDPSNPDVVVDESGRSIWVWDGTPASTRKEVFLRIYPADGGPPTVPVQVNTFVENNQHFPRIAVRGDGSFLVVWLSVELLQSGAASRNVVRSQAFDANANPLGEEWIISTLNPNLSQDNKVDIDVLPNGEYIVVWRSRETFEPGDSSVNIQGRRIAANGVPLAEQFQINSTMTVRRQSIWHHLSFFLRDTFLPVLSPV